MLPVDNTAATATVDFDIAVNVVEPGAGAGGADLLAVVTGTLTIRPNENTFTYTEKGGLATDSRLACTWDVRDRLETVQPADPEDGDLKRAYQYD